MAGDPFVRAEEVESEAIIVGAKRTRIMRAVACLSKDFVLPLNLDPAKSRRRVAEEEEQAIESLASQIELREIGTLRARREKNRRDARR